MLQIIKGLAVTVLVLWGAGTVWAGPVHSMDHNPFHQWNPEAHHRAHCILMGHQDKGFCPHMKRGAWNPHGVIVIASECGGQPGAAHPLTVHSLFFPFLTVDLPGMPPPGLQRPGDSRPGLFPSAGVLEIDHPPRWS